MPTFKFTYEIVYCDQVELQGVNQPAAAEKFRQTPPVNLILSVPKAKVCLLDVRPDDGSGR